MPKMREHKRMKKLKCEIGCLRKCGESAVVMGGCHGQNRAKDVKGGGRKQENCTSSTLGEWVVWVSEGGGAVSTWPFDNEPISGNTQMGAQP